MKLFYKFVLTLAQTLARQLRFSINAIAPIPRPPKTAMGKIVCNRKKNIKGISNLNFFLVFLFQMWIFSGGKTNLQFFFPIKKNKKI